MARILEMFPVRYDTRQGGPVRMPLNFVRDEVEILYIFKIYK